MPFFPFQWGPFRSFLSLSSFPHEIKRVPARPAESPCSDHGFSPPFSLSLSQHHSLTNQPPHSAFGSHKEQFHLPFPVFDEDKTPTTTIALNPLDSGVTESCVAFKSWMRGRVGEWMMLWKWWESRRKAWIGAGRYCCSGWVFAWFEGWKAQEWSK